MKYSPQYLRDVVCSQCKLNISRKNKIVSTHPPGSIIYGCVHSIIDIIDDEIDKYVMYWDTEKDGIEHTYLLEAYPDVNETELWLDSEFPSGGQLINIFDYVIPLPIKDGVLEIDKLIQRLLNMKVFY